MPAAATARCSRCGYESTHLAKDYVARRLRNPDCEEVGCA